MGSTYVMLAASGAKPAAFVRHGPSPKDRPCARQPQAFWAASAASVVASPPKGVPALWLLRPTATHQIGARRPLPVRCGASEPVRCMVPEQVPYATSEPVRCVAPETSTAVAVVAPDPADDPEQMVWTLARLPLAQKARTLAVAAGKLASEAGTTYTTIIGAKLLVSRQLRFQDAFLTIGLTMCGNLLQLLEARWEIELERHFQNTMVPWLAKRRSQNVPHDAATFSALGKLTEERSTQWVEAGGLIGRLGSSFYAALGNSHQMPRALLAVMVGAAVVRHALSTWWTQHIQQRVTDWTLERGRATFALLRGAGMGLAQDVATNENLLARSRTRKLALKRVGIGVESVHEAILLATYYGMFLHLGWFAPHVSLDSLVTVQAGMAAAQSLVASILMVPLFVIGQMQMHTRVQTYLRAEAH